MNCFFVDKVRKIKDGLLLHTGDPLATLRSMMQNRTSIFSLSCVHPDEVEKIVRGLKNSKSYGVDNIDTYILKLIIEDVLPVITHVVNLTITQKSFPSIYKKAKVIPLLKKGDPLIQKNYRPVSILCVVSKVIERVVFKQIVEYMESNLFLCPNHHGFRCLQRQR